ncbi:MAG: DUF3568 family protein [Lentisphaeria bacterium]|jgi:hypothetical protein
MVAKRRIGNGHWLALVMALAGGLLAAPGCVLFVAGAAAGAGAAGVAYVKGEMRGRMEAEPRGVEKAAVKAFEVLEIRKISAGASALDAEVVGRTATDKKVTVTAKAAGKAESDVAIRVGVFGDEALSRRIYDEIKAQLHH